MQFETRLEYLDYCVAGNLASFNEFLSTRVFDTFDRSYEIYRDHVKRKASIESVQCEVDGDQLVVHLKSKELLPAIISDNIPKRGIECSQKEDGVDLHMRLINIINTDYKEGDECESMAT